MSTKLFNKNFTMMVTGQIISLFGNSILRFALSLYVLDLTGSATVFGSILAFSILPVIFLSPIGGMLADRVNRRNIMYMLDFVTAGLIFAASFLLSGDKTIAVIGILLVLLSVIQAFYQPSVQSSVPLLQSNGNLIQANSVVNQINALAGLLGPIIGGALYGIFGLGPILIISGISFFASAILELFLVIPFVPNTESSGIIATIKQDVKVSLNFMVVKQPDMLKLLLVVSSINLFAVPIVTVGMPFLVRISLELSAEKFGFAQGFMGAAGILGGILSGVIANKLKIKSLYKVLAVAGVSFMPVGIALMLQFSSSIIYAVIVISFGLFQMLACIFSIFALSVVQMRTPNELLGKIMSYIGTISMCAQPVGQAVYGVLFDQFSGQLYLIIIGTALLLFVLGLSTKQIFSRLSAEI